MDKISSPVILPSGVTIDEPAIDDLIKRKEMDPFDRNHTISSKTKNIFAVKVIEILKESEINLECHKNSK